MSEIEQVDGGGGHLGWGAPEPDADTLELNARQAVGYVKEIETADDLDAFESIEAGRDGGARSTVQAAIDARRKELAAG